MARERITKNMLQLKVKYINKILNRPAESSIIDNNGNWHSLTGHIMIDHYSPGNNPYQWKLTEYGNDDGGQIDWTNYRMSLREFYAYLIGVCDGLSRSK